mgnify:CR=1 FL=1
MILSAQFSHFYGFFFSFSFSFFLSFPFFLIQIQYKGPSIPFLLPILLLISSILINSSFLVVPPFYNVHMNTFVRFFFILFLKKTKIQKKMLFFSYSIIAIWITVRCFMVYYFFLFFFVKKKKKFNLIITRTNIIALWVVFVPDSRLLVILYFSCILVLVLLGALFMCKNFIHLFFSFFFFSIEWFISFFFSFFLVLRQKFIRKPKPTHTDITLISKKSFIFILFSSFFDEF